MSSQHSQPGPYKRDIPDFVDGQDNARVSTMLARAPITKAIIAINVIVFVLMAILSGGQSLSQASQAMMLGWGADYGPRTLTSQYWRIFTNTFLHFDILHIGFNMYVFWDVGPVVENLYGKSKLVFVYLFAGIVGSLCSLYFHPSGIGAGASGAVFGAFGALLVFLRRYADRFQPGVARSAIRSILMLVVLNLALGMSKTYIDNSAHIGGLLAGAIAGYACLPRRAEAAGWSGRNVFFALVLIAAAAAGFQFDVEAFRQLQGP